MLSPRHSLLRFFEFAFGIAHTLAPDSVELWVRGHVRFRV
jgi:hypothetical protein